MKVEKFLIVLFILTLLACKKEEKVTAPMVPQQLYTCHDAVMWNYSRVTAKLVGKWNWEYISCYWEPEDANGTDHLGQSLNFKEDGTLEVRENGTLTQTSTWTVDVAWDTYSLQTDPPHYELTGYILFCDDLVEFFNSYIDGCDNYYRKED